MVGLLVQLRRIEPLGELLRLGFEQCQLGEQLVTRARLGARPAFDREPPGQVQVRLHRKRQVGPGQRRGGVQHVGVRAQLPRTREQAVEDLRDPADALHRAARHPPGLLGNLAHQGFQLGAQPPGLGRRVGHQPDALRRPEQGPHAVEPGDHQRPEGTDHAGQVQHQPEQAADAADEVLGRPEVARHW
ncbi:hypothetical protein [Amycolatopsis sp. H20-H5]|uniref:hypothetical protein n=1 Tax=Amycolatopsis sp. H20-H5 TaxID=3046309 RepID=UPI002DB68315|nr:hypothetical protein [Amycolatopsis sp. H20-H5]MEC3977364.1 hypothetical protein [Amycolatopsis sp. H20-H5]